MSNRLKFILLGLILTNIQALAELPSFTDKENSEHYLTGNTEVVVSGLDEVEVDWTNNGIIDENGESPQKVGFWAENGSTIKNRGNIYSSDYNSKSKFGALIVGWIVNGLNRVDTLVKLENKSILFNEKNGTIVSGGLLHKLSSNGIGGIGGSLTGGYAEYQKNVILSNDSTIINSGKVGDVGDRVEVLEIIDVDILKYANAKYEKNIINLTNGSFQNNIDGLVEVGRDRNPKLTTYIGVSLANLGIRYYRDISAIKGNGTVIENTGTIFVGGDIYENENGLETGVGLDLLGADFLGEHKKYGVNLTGGILTNTGKIEVERDYTKAKLKDGTIIDLKLIANEEILGLGLLSFNNMDEYSVGVNLDNSIFVNDSGIIKVGANTKTNILDTSKTGAIAVIGKNNSNISFKGSSNIELEGTNVYISNLEGNSTITFDGITTVNQNINNDKVNKKLLQAKDTSKHIVKGQLVINGGFDNTGGNIEISDGGSIENQALGQIIIQDEFLFNEDIKINTSNMIGLSQEKLAKYSNQSLIVAGNGISGDGKLVSNSYLFDVTGRKESIEEEITKDVNNKEEIKLESVERKDFTTIVDNNELGNLLENSYETLTETQRSIYEQLALASNEREFLQELDEITGRKNVNTISAQVYDITKDLTKNYRELVKDIREDGVSFKYISSKSEFSNTDIAEGFKRDSYGLVANYNRNLNEKLRAGFGFGYLKSDIDYMPSESSNKIETWNFRGYSDYNFGKINILSDFSFGYNDIENNRISDGILNKGKVETYTFGLNNSLYKEIKVNNKLILVPSLNLDMTYLLQKNYKEDKGAEFKESDNFYIRSGVNLLGEYNLFSIRNHKVNLKINLEYSYDLNDKVEEVEGKIYGFNDYIKYEARDIDKSSLIYDIELKYEYQNNYSIGVKYTKELINDVDNEQIGINLSYKF